MNMKYKIAWLERELQIAQETIQRLRRLLDVQARREDTGMALEDEVELFDAINEFAEAPRLSVARQHAVVRIKRIVADMLAPLDEEGES